MVESIANVEWIQRSVFDVRGSSTGSEGIGKHLKRHRNREYVQRQRAAMPVEQRRLIRTRNVQVSTSTGDLVYVVTHSLT